MFEWPKETRRFMSALKTELPFDHYDRPVMDFLSSVAYIEMYRWPLH